MGGWEVNGGSIPDWGGEVNGGLWLWSIALQLVYWTDVKSSLIEFPTPEHTPTDQCTLSRQQPPQDGRSRFAACFASFFRF